MPPPLIDTLKNANEVAMRSHSLNGIGDESPWRHDFIARIGVIKFRKQGRIQTGTIEPDSLLDALSDALERFDVRIYPRSSRDSDRARP